MFISYRKSWSVLGPQYQNPEWEVLNIEQAEYRNNSTRKGKWDSIRIKVTVQRRNKIHFYIVVLPYTTGVLLAFMSFLQPMASTKRLTFSLTSMSFFMMILMLLSLELGYHSISVPYCVRMCSISLIFITFSLMLSYILRCFLLGFSQTAILPPRVLTVVIDNVWVTRISFLSRQSSDTSILIEEDPNGNNTDNKHETVSISKDLLQLSQLIDRLCFYVYVMIAVVSYA